MVYVLIDRQAPKPLSPLAPNVIYLFSENFGPRNEYTHVYSNPSNLAALISAGFRSVDMFYGNSIFYIPTDSISELETALNKAFGANYRIFHSLVTMNAAITSEG